MHLGIIGVPQRVETPSPGGNYAGDAEKDEPGEGNGADKSERRGEKRLELFGRDLGSKILGKSNELNETEYACPLLVSSSAANGIFQDLPKAEIWSLLLIGRNRTKGICILASVPRANQVA